MDAPTANPTAPSAPLAQAYPFAFSGQSGEFFRIWIVNVALTIATLGIYSAWAKVRTTRYLYGNTQVAGDSFEYHAKPMDILKGRLIAMALLVVYVLLVNFLPFMAAILILALSAAAPWMIVRALRFRARMTSWRNVRFDFVGTTGEAFSAYALMPLLAVITLGLGMPYVWYKQSQFSVDGHRLGNAPFQLQAGAGQFYVIALVTGLIALVSFVVLGRVLGALMVESVAEDPEGMAPAILGLLIIGGTYAIVFAIYKGLRFRAIYNNLSLAEHRVDNSIGISHFMLISLTNSAAILVSLGLLYPWAKIRMTRFLVNAMTLHATEVDGFVAQQPQDTSAFGEEFGEAFDLGIGV